MESERVIRPPESQKLKSGRVKLEPGEEIGEHVTEKREEILVILKGEATVWKEGGEEKKVPAGGTHFVEEDVKHNVLNKGDKPLEYIYTVTLFES